jgi:hypothetical protein
MNNARDPVWLKHLFRYQQQLRGSGRTINPSDVEILKVCTVLVLAEQRPSARSEWLACSRWTKPEGWR